MSSSVADSVEFARKRLRIRAFEDSEGTEIFLRTVDRLFDILNISSPHGRGWKAPIDLSKYDQVKSFLAYIKKWILSLKNSSDERLSKTQRYIGFIGMWMNMNSVEELMAKFLSTGRWQYILTYKFSQDHLELLLNAIRRADLQQLRQQRRTSLRWSATFAPLLSSHASMSDSTCPLVPSWIPGDQSECGADLESCPEERAILTFSFCPLPSTSFLGVLNPKYFNFRAPENIFQPNRRIRLFLYSRFRL